MIPEFSYAFLSKECISSLKGGPRSIMIIPEGTPVYVTRSNDVTSCYEGVIKLNGRPFRIYMGHEKYLKPADPESLDKNLLKVFDELEDLAFRY